MAGVQETFAKHCGDGTRVWNLLPVGQSSGYGYGTDLNAGADLAERKSIFGMIGDIYITVEGGPGVSQEARTAHARGAAVVPMMRTGGASNGMFDFPKGALQKPLFSTKEQWGLLKNEDATVDDSAAALVAIVEACMRDSASKEQPSAADTKDEAMLQDTPVASLRPVAIAPVATAALAAAAVASEHSPIADRARSPKTDGGSPVAVNLAKSPTSGGPAATPPVATSQAVASRKQQVAADCDSSGGGGGNGSPVVAAAAAGAAAAASPAAAASSLPSSPPPPSSAAAPPQGGGRQSSHSPQQIMGTGPMQFRVTVPKPYPGVQYRKSMNMEDRWPRYAQTDSIVKGVIEEGGQWLRLEHNVFLPMKVGDIKILSHMPTTDSAGTRISNDSPIGVGSAATRPMPSGGRAGGPGEAPGGGYGGNHTSAGSVGHAGSSTGGARGGGGQPEQAWWMCCSVCSSSASTDGEVIVSDGGGQQRNR